MADSEFLFDGEVWEKKVYRNKHTEINDWLRSKQTTGKSKRTLNEYSRTAKKFFHEEFPELDPEDVTVRDIEKYLAKLNQRSLSQNTKRRYLESLSAFYSWALQRPRYQEITGNPAAVILEEVPKRPDCATWENAKAIVDAVEDPRNFTVTAILAKTGCRASEACEIKLDDLLLEEGFIRLRKRKGGKTPDETRQRHLPEAQPKCRSSIRSACHPRLRPVPVTRGDRSTSGVVVVFGDAQPVETVAVRPRAGRPRSGGHDR